MNNSDIKIRKEIVEKYIQEFAGKIQHMDEKTLPAVMLELQAQEADFWGIKDYKSITAFSKDTLEIIFPCWFFGDEGEGEEWFEDMEAEEIELQSKEA